MKLFVKRFEKILIFKIKRLLKQVTLNFVHKTTITNFWHQSAICTIRPFPKMPQLSLQFPELILTKKMKIPWRKYRSWKYLHVLLFLN